MRWLLTVSAAASLFAASAPCLADAPIPDEALPPQTRDPWMVHANVGVPVASYLGTMGAQKAGWITPADRFTVLQLVGGGYWVQPHIRLNLTMQIAETLSGIPSSASPLTTLAAIAWAAYTQGPFFGGIGGVVAPRSYGTWDTDAGIFTCLGVGIPVGGGFTVGGAVQAPVMLARRISFVVSPAAFVAYRF